jgi:glycosyltransferase involved in cell wall biosynthesis
MQPLRVAIDARIRPGVVGGVENVLIGLAAGLAEIEAETEEYTFLALEDHEWLQPYIGQNTRVVTVHEPLRWRLRRQVPPIVRRVASRLPNSYRTLMQHDGSSLALTSGSFDVIHFAHQNAFTTDVPSIFHPHDLQHIHLPDFFSPDVRWWREQRYRQFCEQAAMVAVASGWTKVDVETHFGLDPGKVTVVPLAAPISVYRRNTPDADRAIRATLNLPERYILYPAQTWPHKNHVGLLRAMALLRSRGLAIELVSPGRRNANFQSIRTEQSRLGLDSAVTWPGFVSEQELLAMYSGATAVVIPSRFEAASFPLWEAFQAGVAAACSTATSLPEQAGDAALLFDPDDVPGMADAIAILWTDEAARSSLIERGRRMVENRTWSATANVFRAHYRRLAGRPLSPSDHALVDAVASI